MSAIVCYMFLPYASIGEVDFSEVLQTSESTVRISVDGTTTFVKWEGETIPPSVARIEGTEGPKTHEETCAILCTEAWTPPINQE